MTLLQGINWKRRADIYISSEIAFDYEIIEGILDWVEKGNELRISSLFKECIKIYYFWMSN